ncbi:hypothetical protein QTQ03_20545 [Micromonospora sp. WMMA1363]|uniref:hypothetical protein n=1 Tax=Micromonospora sp. WMMA1363 TaxID=3053985 RepID=UPI00259C7969|nr:hypothetical protein [Micromonospora sp. WMMA1363]MDM4721869.1 hypothetical protein [Micromonospora sp. WMMA1363]
MTLDIGDWVRIQQWPVNGHAIGDVGSVDEIVSGGYNVRVPGKAGVGWYEPDELRHVPPPAVPRMLPVVPDGMTPQDLAAYVGQFVQAAQDRILTFGADQYDNNGRQAFEDMPLIVLLHAAREEAQDLAAYAAMLDIRIGRILAALGHKGVR